jgi:predicted helicase
LENTERIKRQNDRTISVIIGNPPYNANQQNENDNNANRDYPAIDKLIKESYVKYSNAQKTKVYDPYIRFLRWATNRLNHNGIIAFITNSSFINAKAFDGFRKAVADEFSNIYIIDLGGDVRSNPKISGTKHNVFGIQAGVAISFLIKKNVKRDTPCLIYYTNRPDLETAEEKLKFIAFNKIEKIPFTRITPDVNNNWINIDDTDFNTLLPLANKETKSDQDERAVFKLFSFGVSTNRDEWVYDNNFNNLISKIQFFTKIYNNQIQIGKSSQKNSVESLDNSIKWSESLKSNLYNQNLVQFDDKKIIKLTYRPYYNLFYYSEHILSDRLTSIHNQLYGTDFHQKNLTICLTIHEQVPFVVQATDYLFDAGLGSRGTQGLPLYRYDKQGNRIDNITDWGLKQIQTHYQNETITKIDIFHYTYSVLHNPEYRRKYELNLKREFPRLPYYENFQKWVNWGKQLMELHINYETVTPYQLTRVDIPLKDNQKTIKVKLKADKNQGVIILDDITTLTGVPDIAWEYMLGNRSALEWILDQYKEKKPKDTTIAEKFNNYRFADYKEQVIELLMRVCTVSVETMKIIKEMSESG